MSQSKRHSALETATNTAVGFVGSYFITFGCFHLNADLATKTLYATLGCTVWSLLRGYYLRRLFNHLHMRPVQEPPIKLTGLGIASGVELDNFAAPYGLTRDGESDSVFRCRIREAYAAKQRQWLDSLSRVQSQ